MSNFLVKCRPTLTVMVQGRTPERICELMKRAREMGGDAVGIQLERLERKYHTEEIFKLLIEEAGDMPTYVTNYCDGVNSGIDTEILAEELISFASLGGSLIDIPGDWFYPSKHQITYDKAAVEKQVALIEKLHALGSEVLVSSHVFEYIPLKDAMKIADAHIERGADITKIVTAANSKEELGESFKISGEFYKKFGSDFLFLCGGSECTRHRRLAPLISNGLYLCVVEHDDLATPVQPLLSDAKAIIESIINENK